MPTQHTIAPGWILLEGDDGSVFLLEDVHDLPGAGADEVRHGPFPNVEAARTWLADALQHQAEMQAEDGERRRH